MPTLKQIYFASVLVLALLTTAAAQESTSSSAQRSSLTITAAAAGERVRITAPSSVVQMHVEVYAASGEKLFDQEIRGGNVFDWHLQDGQAQRLAPRELRLRRHRQEHLRQAHPEDRHGDSCREISQSCSRRKSKQLSAAQAQYIGPVEENSSWTIAGKDEPQTPTVIANDGTDGQMIRGRGALTFRIGNFFSGIDTEQMRLTEEGNLGIGTSEPKSKLDVAGTIRAERFLVVKPNLVKGDKAATDAQTTEAVDSVQPLIAGTGTLNHIAKWTPDGSTLGDSGIFETAGGFVGIGTTSPVSKLSVVGESAFAGGASVGLGYAGTAAPSNGLIIQGNVGIGTTSPAARLTIQNTAGLNNSVTFNNSSGTFKAAFGMAGAANGIITGTVANDFAIRSASQKIFFSADNGTTAHVVIDTAGNVGIGNTAPIFKFDVAGNLRSFGSSSNDVVVQTTGGTNNWARYNIRTSNQNWVLGSSQNFNGDQFYLYDSTWNTTRMMVQPNNGPIKFPSGNISIGTTNDPTHRLSISGGPTWTSNAWTGSVALDNASAIGWGANASGTHFGIGQTNGGLYFFQTSSNLGSSAAPANYSMILDDGGNTTVTGNASQSRDKGGLAKGMMLINSDGTILRCYNGVPGTGGTDCGFTAHLDSLGRYTITFPFQVDDRYVVAQSYTGSTSVSLQAGQFGNNQMIANTYYSFGDHVGDVTNSAFVIIVY